MKAHDCRTAGRRHRRIRFSKLAGRVALVTGGTRGIGAAISRSLANQGATVAAGYGRDKEHAEEFLAEIQAEGVKGSIHQGNIGVGDDCRRVVAGGDRSSTARWTS